MHIKPLFWAASILYGTRFWVLVLATFYCVWNGVEWLMPDRPEYTPRQMAMAGDLAEQAGSWLDRLGLDRGRAVFGNLDRDAFGVVSMPLRQTIWRIDRFDLLEPGIIERLQTRLGSKIRTYGNVSDLGRAAQSRKARYAIGGELIRFVDTSSESLLQARLYVWDAATKNMVDEKAFEIRRGFSFFIPPISGPVAQIENRLPITFRLFVWMAVTALVPLLVFLSPKRILEDGSNLVIFLVLAGLTGISGILSFLFVARGMDAFWCGFVMLVLVPISALYHFKVLAFFRTQCVSL
ncbi:MAG TPA: hypothetical protein P5555_08860 [Candidatus Paceibacterota bacterium]|nr:hypothetical protein [Verrucomicrobiota bacterium]HRZ45284.1 hypothetical protein [Candidatus Paceibacterota bacterium]